MVLLIFLYFVGFSGLVAGTVSLSLAEILINYIAVTKNFSIIVTIAILFAMMTLLSCVTFDIFHKLFEKWGLSITVPAKKSLILSIFIASVIMTVAFVLMRVILMRLTDSPSAIVVISLFSILFGLATKRYVDSVFSVNRNKTEKQ